MSKERLDSGCVAVGVGGVARAMELRWYASTCVNWGNIYGNNRCTVDLCVV